MFILQIFLTGLGVLVAALAFNYLAGRLSLSTWYDFVKKPKDTNAASYIWLFMVYPFGLGAAAYGVLELVR